MRIEIENITKIVKRQAMLNGPRLIRRGLVEISISAAKAGIALSDMSTSTKKENNKK